MLGNIKTKKEKTMNRRIAKKILNPDGFHWSWYKNRVGMRSLAPVNAPLYFKACRTLGRKPYYDSAWLKLIGQFRNRED